MRVTNEQKEKIIELRKMGIGYRSIAKAMNISRDKVRNFCKAQGLDGYASGIKKKETDENTSRQFCKNCGARINENPTKGRPKKYCSIECKRLWEAAHPIMYEHVCYYCGKKFTNKAYRANFCSNKCYIRDRFWRKEDVEIVMEHLNEGTPIPNAPGWIKDLIMGKEDYRYDKM